MRNLIKFVTITNSFALLLICDAVHSTRDDRPVCAGAYEGLGSLWVVAVATYIQRKYKQKQITHDGSSVI